MDYNNSTFFVYDEDRVAVECTVISKFVNEDTGVSYMVYTDGSRNEEGKKNLYVVSYDPDDASEDSLRPVESLEEWQSISGFLEELRKVIDEKGIDL